MFFDFCHPISEIRYGYKLYVYIRTDLSKFQYQTRVSIQHKGLNPLCYINHNLEKEIYENKAFDSKSENFS